MDNTNQVQDNFYVKHATKIAVGTITMVMILVGILFWQQGKTIIEAKKWVIHTYEVRSHIRMLANHIKDASLAQRGYLLTGNEEYLDIYNEVLYQFPI